MKKGAWISAIIQQSWSAEPEEKRVLSWRESDAMLNMAIGRRYPHHGTHRDRLSKQTYISGASCCRACPILYYQCHVVHRHEAASSASLFSGSIP
jgi:hypothetical protein